MMTSISAHWQLLIKLLEGLLTWEELNFALTFLYVLIVKTSWNFSKENCVNPPIPQKATIGNTPWKPYLTFQINTALFRCSTEQLVKQPGTSTWKRSHNSTPFPLPWRRKARLLTRQVATSVAYERAFWRLRAQYGATLKLGAGVKANDRRAWES